MKRRVFLSALMTGAAGALAPRVQAQERRAVRPVPRVRRRTQILVKGGTVLSLDPKVGDFDVADVLIDGATIAAVGPNLPARADAEVLDASHAFLYLYFSQYGKPGASQGVAIARMPWADRDTPVGAFSVLQHGAWIPPRQVDADVPRWEYPAGTPLVAAGNPWHDADFAVDAFWGASIHWNTYLERYVMLLNRAKNEHFDNEGIYVSFSAALDDAAAWSAPRKLMNGGDWYPQVAGLEPGGTDRQAGQRARFFLVGRSSRYIEFSR